MVWDRGGLPSLLAAKTEATHDSTVVRPGGPARDLPYRGIPIMSDVLSWIRLPGPFLIGHRGLPSAARENTLPAFEAALEAGCDGVEFDLHMTADGVLAVHHDPVATGPEGPLHLDRIDWNRLEGTKFQGREGAYRIPRLEAVAAALTGRCLLNVEVKAPGPGRHGTVADRLLAVLETVRPRESVLVSSFDPEVLAAIRRRDASVLLGFLFASVSELNHLEEEEVVESLHALHPRHDLVDAGLMKRARERGLAVNAWTVDDPAEASRLVRAGASAVITNRPREIEPALFEDPAGD